MRRLVLLLPMALCSMGCLGWRMGTIPPGELEAGLQGMAPKRVRPLQLAALGCAVQAEYRVQAGDLLEVTISDLYDESRPCTIPTRVQEDGTIRLPFLGSVPVDTLTVPETERVVFASYSAKGVLKAPQITVLPRETGKVRVSVLGAVNKPGLYELAANENDLLNALVASGGLTQDADTVIEVRRRVATAPPVRHRMMEGPPVRQAGGEPEPVQETPYLPDVPAAGPPVSAAGPYAGGAERTPPVSAAGPYAGGAERIPPVSAAGPEAGGAENTFFEDQPAHPSTSFISLDLSKDEDQQKLTQGVALKNGDIVSVEERKTKPICVVGMVNKPGEYPIPPDRDIRILEAIGLAGGVDRTTLPDKALIIRERPDESGLVTVRIDLNKAKKDIAENIRLMPGDTVSVEETALSYGRGLIRGAFHLGVGASLSPTGF